MLKKKLNKLFYKFFKKKIGILFIFFLNIIKITNSITFLSNFTYFNSLCSNINIHILIMNIHIIIYCFSQKWLIGESVKRRNCIFLNSNNDLYICFEPYFHTYKKIYSLPFKKLKVALKSRKKVQITKKLYESLHLK